MIIRKNDLRVATLSRPHDSANADVARACRPRYARVALFVVLTLPVLGSVARADSIFGLGYSSALGSAAFDVSNDGTVVVGNDNSGSYGFRWTQATGRQNLGTFGGSGSGANALSADGSVVVGWARAGDTSSNSYRWTAASGTKTNLTSIPFSAAYDTSADGSVVVGVDGSRAYRWTQSGGKTSLGTFVGGGSSSAYAVSADGGTVVGGAHLASGSNNAFRWTQAGGMVNLGTLGGLTSFAYDVSGNGLTVVGTADSALGASTAFRWTQAGGMASLGTLGGTTSVASGVSFDGAVVVGDSKLAGDTASAAFIWDAAHGMRTLSSVLNDAGVSTGGWTLLSANGIASDGTNYYIVGSATNSTGVNEAFLANLSVSSIPEPSTYGAFGAFGLGLVAAIRRRSKARSSHAGASEAGR